MTRPPPCHVPRPALRVISQHMCPLPPPSPLLCQSPLSISCLFCSQPSPLRAPRIPPAVPSLAPSLPSGLGGPTLLSPLFRWPSPPAVQSPRSQSVSPPTPDLLSPTPPSPTPGPLVFPLPAPVPAPLTAQCPQGRSHTFARSQAAGSASPSTRAYTSTMWCTRTASRTPAARVARPTDRPPHWPCTSAAPTASWRPRRRASRPCTSSSSSTVRATGRR